MKKNELKKVTKEVAEVTKKVSKKGKGKKALKTVGVVAGVAAFAGVAYALYQVVKSDKAVKSDEQIEKFSDKEQEAIIKLIKEDDGVAKCLASYGLDIEDLSVDDCIGNSKSEYSLEMEGIVIRYRANEEGTAYVIDAYRDPLWDFEQQPNQ